VRFQDQPGYHATVLPAAHVTQSRRDLTLAPARCMLSLCPGLARRLQGSHTPRAGQRGTPAKRGVPGPGSYWGESDTTTFAQPVTLSGYECRWPPERRACTAWCPVGRLYRAGDETRPLPGTTGWGPSAPQRAARRPGRRGGSGSGITRRRGLAVRGRRLRSPSRRRCRRRARAVARRPRCCCGTPPCRCRWDYRGYHGERGGGLLALNLAPVPADGGGQPSSAGKFVLAGLAGHAGPGGTGAFPSVAMLVRCTGLAAAGIVGPCDPGIVAARIKRADRRPAQHGSSRPATRPRETVTGPQCRWLGASARSALLYYFYSLGRGRWRLQAGLPSSTVRGARRSCQVKALSSQFLGAAVAVMEQ
jgi:hypothetical protein